MTTDALDNPGRRRALAWAGAGALGGQFAPARADEAADDAPGGSLAPWRPGQLDIHHLAIGRGSSTLVILPDGTSLLIDAGASANATDVSVPTRPGPERRAGEWIARYVQRQLRATGRDGLDYALMTHLHPDHVGDVAPGLPRARAGEHQLTGIADVAEQLPIGLLVDRGHPDHAYPGGPLLNAPFARNYRAFIAARLAAGAPVERFRVGSAGQFRPLGRVAIGTPFAVRNIAANGEVWRGDGERTRQTFPPLASLASADMPDENMCSAAVRIDSGPFRYFSGADLTSLTLDGAQPWRDILGAAARAAGPVDVATADHHGLFDGVSADVARTLRPQAWVIPTWHISHPSVLQLEHMFSERLYRGARDVFATEVMHENQLMNRRLLRRAKSLRGHVVVRVSPGGESFRVIVTDNGDEQDRLTLATPPYRVTAKD
jgi:glyoxylase-like metal-dependent hydrolase (beta-lactamase superfamily II)